MTKSKAACLFATQILGKEALYMWTFTFGELLDIIATRKRWNHLITLLRQQWPKNIARQLAKRAGWGRIHVMPIPTDRAAYLAKYLSRERPPCFKGWRLWAGFGEWDWTRVKDLVFESRFCRI